MANGRAFKGYQVKSLAGVSSTASRGAGLSIPSFRQRPRPGYQTSSTKPPRFAFPTSNKAFYK